MNCVVPVSYERSLQDHYAAVRARIRSAGDRQHGSELITAERMRKEREAREGAVRKAKEKALLEWLKTAYREVVTPQTFMMKANHIKREVAAKHGVTVEEIDGQCRSAYIVKARQETFWRCQHETGMSLSQIGRVCGGRDHTTVLHGVRKHEARMRGKAA